jgi:oligopeptide transport system substrate-binding protein
LVALLALVLAVGMVLVACSNKPANQPEVTDEKPQVLYLNAGTEPPNMDAQKSTDTVSFEIMNAIFEGLARQNPEGKIEQGSGMAKSWDISADGMKWTFHLKDNVVWSDGVPVKAQDFEYAWKRALDPNTASEYAYQLYYIKNGAEFNDPENTTVKIDDVGVKATDDKTLVVELSAPCAYFDNLIIFPTLFPTRQDLVEKYTDTYAGDFDKMVYNGPFIMSLWRHQAEMVLQKNDQYWDKDSVKLSEIRFAMIQDTNAAINMYETGSLDRVGLSKDFVKTYQDKGEYMNVPNATTWYLQFNTEWKDASGKQPLKNVKIRKALAYAVNRAEFVSKILAPGARPAYGYVPYGLTGLATDKDFRNEAGNLMDPALDGNGEEAKKLLDEGLKELGMTKLDGLVFLGGDQNQTAITRMQYMQEQWRTKLGLEIPIDSPDFKTRLDKMTNRNFTIVWAGWGGDYNDPMTFMDMWVTGGGQNRTGWSNAQYDKDIETAKSTADKTIRMNSMHDAEKILMEEIPISPLYFPGGNIAVKPWFSGFIDWPVGATPELKWATIDVEKRGY